MTQVMNARELADEVERIVATANDFKTSLSHHDVGAWLMCNADRILTALRATSDREAVLEEAARVAEAPFDWKLGEAPTTYRGLANRIASAIRARKSSPTNPKPEGSE